MGRGGAAVGHLLPPGPRPHSLTALTLHICQWPPDISDRSPFYREHAPVGALDTETSPPLKQRSLGGGGSQGEGQGLVGGGEKGGLGREKHLWLENTSSPGKEFNGPLHLVPPTFLP